VALEGQPWVIAVDFDLGLEGRYQRKPAIREGAGVLPKPSEPFEADIRRVGVSLDVKDAVNIPQRHHEVEVLCGLRPMEGSLQLIDLPHLRTIGFAFSSFYLREVKAQRSSHANGDNRRRANFAIVSSYHLKLSFHLKASFIRERDIGRGNTPEKRLRQLASD